MLLLYYLACTILSNFCRKAFKYKELRLYMQKKREKIHRNFLSFISISYL
nr:MAG TPA: hypothetical protein [Crassvirales sp.]